MEGGARFAAAEPRAKLLQGWKRFELFEREAVTLRGLRHHGVLPFHDFFEVDHDERARLYLVQEIIEGTSLSELIDAGGSISPAGRDK